MTWPRPSRLYSRELVDHGLVTLGEELGLERVADRQRDALEGAAGRVGDRAQAAERLLELGRSLRRRVPAVAQRDDPLEGARAVAADPDRRVRLLHGLGREADVAEAEVLPREGRVVLGPQRLEDAQHLVGLPAPLVEGRAQDLELLLPPADADPADEPPVRQRVDAREHLGHDHRVAVPQDEDRGAEPRARRADGGGGEGDDGLEVGLVGRMREAPAGIAAGRLPRKDDVVADPERGDVALLGLAREGHERVPRGHGPLRRKMAADIHRRQILLRRRALVKRWRPAAESCYHPARTR